MTRIPRPILDKVVILPDVPLDKTPSGIHLPGVLSKEGRPEQGKVVAVGPGVWDEKTSEFIPTVVKPGQRVLFRRVSGTDYPPIEKTWHILREGEILGVIDA